MKKALAILFFTFIAAALSAQTSSGSEEGLYKLAQKVRPGFLIGTTGVRFNDPQAEEITNFYKNNFNIMTVTIYMHTTQREKEKYNLEGVDRSIEWAKANNIKTYFHPLIGGAEYCPDWIKTGNYSKEELEKIMRERITTILTRYGDKLDYVDVVNEPLSGNGLTPDGEFNWIKGVKEGEHFWLKTMGFYQGKKYKFPVYFVDAFKIAREVGHKNLKLILNEWNNATTKSPRGITFLNLILAMREEGIPVDGAGLQMHCSIRGGQFREHFGGNVFDFDAFDAMLKMYEDAGIDVHITEFDIHLPQNPTAADFELQGKSYAEVVKHAIKSPAVKSFKTWGFSDKTSYKPDGIDGHPLILDENYKPKPAYTRQIEMLKEIAGDRGK